jgi:hypothetical protein
MNKHGETMNGQDSVGAVVAKAGEVTEAGHAHGTYTAVLRGPTEEFRSLSIALHEAKWAAYKVGNMVAVAEHEAKIAEIPTEEKWCDEFKNIVTTVGGNLGLDTILAGSSYSVTGPYLGLINTNAANAVIADTMASHAAWTEVGTTNAPAYTAPRKTVTFAAASAKSKASSGTMTFTFTSGGTVGGCFLVLGTGAVSTIDSTAGTLYSAGAFTGGSKTVASTDTLTVTYTAGI